MDSHEGWSVAIMVVTILSTDPTSVKIEFTTFPISPVPTKRQDNITKELLNNLTSLKRPLHLSGQVRRPVLFISRSRNGCSSVISRRSS
jgi:hypothetical protein